VGRDEDDGNRQRRFAEPFLKLEATQSTQMDVQHQAIDHGELVAGEQLLA